MGWFEIEIKREFIGLRHFPDLISGDLRDVLKTRKDLTLLRWPARGKRYIVDVMNHIS